MKMFLFEIFFSVLILNCAFATPVTEETADTEVRNSIPQSVFYDGYGLFQLRPGYKKLPEDPKKINTTFLLYKRGSNLVDERISITNLGSFDQRKSVKVIIHGFSDTATNTWVINMKDELLKKEDVNVITVDWSGGNQFPYDQAVANTVIVGTALHQLLKEMIRRGVTGAKIHLIGHSLGAHIAGHTGKLLGNLGRISGLDPAGPDFYISDIDFRLDPSDAVFVDVIHTDGSPNVYEGFGHLQPLGHVDFYPNGGSSQPTCGRDTIGVLFQTITALATTFNTNNALSAVACNHMSAVYYYTESINTKSLPNSYPCSNFSNFELGLCTSCGSNSQCQQMGYNALPSRQLGNLYLLTQHGLKSPFFGTHMKVTIKSNNINDQQTKGTFTININKDLTYTVIDSNTKMIPGLEVSKTILLPATLPHFQEFQFSFQKAYGVTFGIGLSDQWSIPSINFFNINTKQSYQYCPESNLKIRTGSSLKYQLCN